MRLVIDATITGGRISGIERYTSEVAGRLARIKAGQGWQVSLLVRHGRRAAWSDRFSDCRELIVESPFPSQFLTQQLWIPGVVRRAQAEVAFFPGFPPSPLVFWNSNLRTVRTIFDAVMWAAPETISRKNKLYYRPLETFGSRRYAQIHAISEHARIEIEHHLPWVAGRIVVSGCGVSALAEQDLRGACASGVDGEYLLFVGTVEPRKNLPFLLEVFAEILKVRPDLKLVIAGRPGWGQAQLATRIVELELEEEVVLMGAVSDAVLSSLYRRATLLVFPSLHEGFGLPVVEAMMHGLPVICSNASSLPEISGGAAILLPPENREAWVNAIRRVLSHSGVRSRMAIRGRVQAKKFEWEAVATRIGCAL